MEIFNDTILVSLSSVPSEDNSTTYTLDSNLKIISKQNHPYQFITKCIPLERNKHLISAYNFEDGPKPYLFLVEKDKISALGNVLPIKILINSKLIIVDLKTIYEVNDNKLIRKYELDSESVIKDVIFYLDKIYLLVERKETDECLILNDMYGLENRISIGKSFGNSKLFYSNKIEKLLLINQNKFYLIN